MASKMILLAAVSAVALWFPVSAALAAPEIEMVLVKGGCFQMGDVFGDPRTDEKPRHEVCVSDFSIGKYEVTQAQWQAVMDNNPSRFVHDRNPVDTVNWDDTQAFISKLNAMTGRNYRLPTEAEWEYAARSGGRLEKWAGTNEPKQVGMYAWHDKNSEKRSRFVGLKEPNGLGIYDMSGNVWEWCQDRYRETYYGESVRDNPQGPPEGNMRVLRGGSWVNSVGGVRTNNRQGYSPNSRRDYTGFRLVLPAVQEPGQPGAH